MRHLACRLTIYCPLRLGGRLLGRECRLSRQVPLLQHLVGIYGGVRLACARVPVPRWLPCRRAVEQAS